MSLSQQLGNKSKGLLATINSICEEVAQGRAFLNHDRVTFAQIQHEVESLNALQSECEYLSVGGDPFHVSKSALLRGGPHLLSVLASDQFPSERGDDGYIFVDRDSQWFGAVLSYLRDGELHVPTLCHDRHALAREARFYHLDALFDATQEHECLVVVGKGMIQTYYPVTGTWHAMKAEKLAPLAAVVLNRELYIANRCTWPTGEFATLSRRTGRLEKMADLPAHFHIQSGVAIGGVFVMPGFISIGPRRPELVTFTVADRKWGSWGDMAHRRQKFAACELKGRLVVVGGRDLDSNPLRSAEEYWRSSDLGTNDDGSMAGWRPLPDMMEKRSRPAAVVWRGKLVVIGGYNNESGSLNSVEEYDPSTRTWQPLPRMTTPRIGCKAVVLDGELVVIGGLATGNDTEFKSVERYCPRECCWEPMPSMCEAPVDPWAATLHISLTEFI